MARERAPNALLMCNNLGRRTNCSLLAICQRLYVKDGKPTDELASIKIACHHTKRLYGKHSVTEFGPNALKAVRRAMVERGNSRRYTNGNVKRIRRMFKWGVANELVPSFVHQALTTVEALKVGKCDARETDSVLPFDDTVVDATLKHCLPPISAKG